MKYIWVYTLYHLPLNEIYIWVYTLYHLPLNEIYIWVYTLYHLPLNEIYIWVYTLYHLPLNENFDGGEARKFLSRRFCCTTPLTPIPALTTELLLVSNPYSTTPAGLSA